MAYVAVSRTRAIVTWAHRANQCEIDMAQQTGRVIVMIRMAEIAIVIVVAGVAAVAAFATIAAAMGMTVVATAIGNVTFDKMGAADTAARLAAEGRQRRVCLGAQQRTYLAMAEAVQCRRPKRNHWKVTLHRSSLPKVLSSLAGADNVAKCRQASWPCVGELCLPQRSVWTVNGCSCTKWVASVACGSF